MARFAAVQLSHTAAIDVLADLANQSAAKPDVPIATGSFTLTAAQLINGILRLSGQAGINVTLPSAAAIVAALANCQVNSGFEFSLINANTGTATIVAGAGVTLVGTTAVPTVKSQIYKGVVTNATVGAEAVEFIGILTVPV